MKPIFSLLTITNYAHAQILVSQLESYGIPCYVRNLNLIGPEINENVEIWISESNIEKAGRLVREFHFAIKEGGTKVTEKVATKLFIVPLDFSNASENAAKYAVDLAATLSSSVKLIHTYMVPQIHPVSLDDTDVLTETVYSSLASLRKTGEEKLTDIRDRLTKYMNSKNINVPVETYQVNGFIDETTLFQAEHEKAGLIVLGLSSPKQELFDTINENVMQIVKRSKIPVLVVPENAVKKPAGKPKKILYVSNFDESDFMAIQKLIGFVEKENVQIHCLHLESKENPWDKVKMEGLKNYFHKANEHVTLKFDTMVATDSVVAIDQYIKVNQVDLLAITRLKHNFVTRLLYPEITKRLIFHTQVPLLVFRFN
jgi:nucleotide-binding universal stress UspA family protein